MNSSREIPWVIEEHTKIKHQLLNDYLGAWISIMYSQQARLGTDKKLIFVDGFSGPGEYWEDESRNTKVNGSPILVAEKANKYIDEDTKRKFIIIAIDNDKGCVEHLKPLLAKTNKHRQDWHISHQTFQEGMDELFGYLEKENARIAPAFFFIDPFGYSGFTMDTMARILKHPRTELFINFMHYDINRFWQADHARGHLESLFGSEEYKNAAGLNSDEKTSFFVGLYCKQLKAQASAPYILPFRLNTPGQGRRPRYFLVHVSQHIKALKEMKNRMARLSSQSFRFEAIGLSPEKQLDLFELSDENKLKEEVFRFISSQKERDIPYQDLENWAYEQTAGIDKEIKSVLMSLERESKILIKRKPRQLKTTVTEGAAVRFIAQQLTIV